VNGDELLERIRALAAEVGLRIHHGQDSRKDLTDPGFPDVVLAGGELVLFRELKPDGRAPKADQVAWKWSLLASGADWAVWTPADWVSGRIEAEMTLVTAKRRLNEAIRAREAAQDALDAQRRSDADSRPSLRPQSDSGAVSGTE
jgi:hypothetical protein